VAKTEFDGTVNVFLHLSDICWKSYLDRSV
jgi:hypothetical protein